MLWNLQVLESNIIMNSSSSTWICCALTFLSLDISLLVSFSISLIAKAQPTAFFIVLVVLTIIFIPVLINLLRYGHRLKSTEDAERALISFESEDVDEEFLKALSGLPTRFSYKDLVIATENFSKKLGRGGFGTVYEGILPDKTKVAVKRLEKEGRGQKEFCAEVATISRSRHLNLVTLRGFCSAGAQRLLVYEFMSRGSLDRWLFPRKDGLETPTAALDWKTRFRIALETAHGLAYLHDQCEERILHLDVKPENILLDDQFRAKVSDFGLSRAMDREQSRLVTTMRGTPGYLAPEWLLATGVDSKTDVYSYGMVVLELISGRRSVDMSQPDSEDWYLPAVAFKKLNEAQAMTLVDPALNGKQFEADSKQVELLLKVALWCIQEKTDRRPLMVNVVQMLEGHLDVKDPPAVSNFLYTRDDAGRPCLWISINPETISEPR